MKKKLEFYGLPFNPDRFKSVTGRDLTQLDIEMRFCQNDGLLKVNGLEGGRGMLHHFKAMQDCLWPDLEWHRWREQGTKALVENEISVFMGPGDSNKTYLCSMYVVADWLLDPAKTLWMVSSTEERGAELRNWGQIKNLWNEARELYPWLPGCVLESKHCITPDQITESGLRGRLLTRGIIFIPCKSGNTWLGMGAYAGIKPPKNGKLGHYGSECSFMQRSFLDAYANWFGKPNFKGVLEGNPTDIEDCLCIAAEPDGGWSNWVDTGKTQQWRSRWYGAFVTAYDGRDTPNNDFPTEGKQKFPYLIGKKKLNSVLIAERGDVDSPIYRSQCVGKPSPGQQALKVLTWQMVEQGKAMDDVIWEGSDRTLIAGLDAAYSGTGGDRCVLLIGEFGNDVDGRQVLLLHPPQMVPVKIHNNPSLDIPETQIAKFCNQACTAAGVSPDRFYFDARSTLAVELGRHWSPQVNSVDFGGGATKRPVSQEEFVFDQERQERRLLRCDEKYSKFVTELWFSVRYAILGQQIRKLPSEMAEEGCKRVWRMTKGNPPKIEVETKREMKARTKQSPDLFDALATLVEGARRQGFQIKYLNDSKDALDFEEDYLQKELHAWRDTLKARSLKYN